MKRFFRYILSVVVMSSFLSGCFLFEEEEKVPDVATVRTNSYSVPTGYTIYLVVHNLTTSTKNVAIWGDNLNSSGTTKSVFSSLDTFLPNTYPIIGLPPSFVRELPQGNWREWFSRSFKGVSFTYGSANPIDYGRNPSNWVIGTTKLQFTVVNLVANTYSNITAKLYAIGTNTTIGASPLSVPGGVAYIFVDENDTNVTSAIITTLATNFNGTNGIYAKLTNVLGGYEDGGGPTGDGGVDTNRNIYILLHDIQDGFAGMGGFVAGYYDPRNDFPTTSSSRRQMFVIDTYPTLQGGNTGLAISTLIHEAQHMINFGQKYFIGKVQEETWLNEACSLMVEDVLDEFVPSSDRVYANNSRMSYFVSRPERGLFMWDDVGGDVLYDYGKAYAYLAFLVRNTSPRLLKEIVSGVGRDKTGGAAVNAALQAVNANKDFATTVKLWRKASIYNAFTLSSSWSGYRSNTNVAGYELRELDLRSYTNNKNTTGPVFYHFRSSSTVFTFEPYSTLIFKGIPVSGNNVTVYISDDPQLEVEVIITNL